MNKEKTVIYESSRPIEWLKRVIAWILGNSFDWTEGDDEKPS